MNIAFFVPLGQRRFRRLTGHRLPGRLAQELDSCLRAPAPLLPACTSLMYTPISFTLLTTSQQIRYLRRKGFHVTGRTTRAFRFRLFSVHSYFVELCVDRRDDRLIGIYPLPLELVEAYYANHVSLVSLLQ